jgi:hypothetical protein
VGGPESTVSRLLGSLLATAVAVPAAASAGTPEPFAPGLHLAVGASLDRSAVSADLGGRWAPLARVGLGLDLELNPWIDLLSGSLAPGVASLVGSGFYRWTQGQGLELRTTVHLGTSVLLFDAVGAPAGSVGAYVGLGALSALLQVAPHTWLEIKPDVVVPVPQLRGTPFAYRQYRMMIGLEWHP